MNLFFTRKAALKVVCVLIKIFRPERNESRYLLINVSKVKLLPSRMIYVLLKSVKRGQLSKYIVAIITLQPEVTSSP